MTTKSGNDPKQVSPVLYKKLQALSHIDQRLVALLTERAGILSDEGSWRKDRHLSHADPELEKRLWAVWETDAKELGLDRKILKKLFNLANMLGQTSKTGKAAANFILAPRKLPVNMEIKGPRSISLTRKSIFLAAAANVSVTLDHVALNDPLNEMIKAFNQLGASLSWSEGSVKNRPGKGEAKSFEFEDELVLTGNTVQTLYLLTALALGGAGRCKFAGGPDLKLLDLKPLNKALPMLGARIVNLNPHAPGLPARLEYGGDMASEVTLHPDVPDDFAQALVLSAWSYPNGLVIKKISVDQAVEFKESVELLNRFGVKARLEDGKCIVPKAMPVAPSDTNLPMDPLLCSHLLALPLFLGGKATLRGVWPAKDIQARLIAKQFSLLGAQLEVTEARATLKPGRLPDEADFPMGRREELLPLALALALGLKKARIELPSTGLPDTGREMLDRLGASYEIVEGMLALKRSTLTWEGSWTSPDPYTTMALSLAACIKPGIAIDNPGDLTALWPAYWNIYNALPTGQYTKPEKQTPQKKSSNGKRRIKI